MTNSSKHLLKWAVLIAAVLLVLPFKKSVWRTLDFTGYCWVVLLFLLASFFGPLPGQLRRVQRKIFYRPRRNRKMKCYDSARN